MKWRVYNMHPNGFTHKEIFRGDLITIKANDFVEMDYEDAVQFKGQYFPMKSTADGQQDPISYKCIEIKPSEKVALVESVTRWVCHLDGKEFSTKQELETYTKSKYADVETLKDDSLDAELEKEVIQKKRGRPAKEATL